MGELKEFKKYEIIFIDVNGKQFLGKTLLGEDGLDPYILVNPAMILFRRVSGML